MKSTFLVKIDNHLFVLEQYGSVKLAIQELSNQSEKMKTEVSSLQTQNRDLYKDNQRIISSLIDLRHTLEWLVSSIPTMQ